MPIKKLGNWWIPLNHELVSNIVLTEQFPCVPTLLDSWKEVLKFDVAVDIGTWIGDSTVAMSKQFTNVIGFEANPAVYQCCIQNLLDRHITNCHVHPLGLSNISAVQPFYNKGNSTWSGWISTKETDQNHQMIKTCKLDDMNLIGVDFLKIDVDGHEGYLLEGAKEFLKNNSPVVLCEIKIRSQLERQPLDSPNPFQILKDAGYILLQKISKADYLFVKEI